MTLEERRSAEQRQTEDAIAHGEPDPNRRWQRPQHDGEVLFVEWWMPDGFQRHAYVWLHDMAHPLAEAQGMLHGPGAAALKYHAICLTYGMDPRYGLVATQCHAHEPARWEDITHQLRLWSMGAEQDNGGVLWGHDFAVLMLAGDFHAGISTLSRVRVRSPSEVASPPPSQESAEPRASFTYQPRSQEDWEARANQTEEEPVDLEEEQLEPC
jgi:hypothetical protein